MVQFNYGYNAEPSNSNTGLQYLRARYYNPVNGNFTSDDTEAGGMTNPLTQNRYDYVTNNPLNYADPTGDKLGDRVKAALNRARNGLSSVGSRLKQTAKNVVNKAASTLRNAAAAVKNRVTSIAQNVKNTTTSLARSVQTAKTSVGQKIRRRAQDTSAKMASAGAQFIRKASQAGQRAQKTFSSFASYAAERTAQIKETVKKHVCTSTERISTALSKVYFLAKRGGDANIVEFEVPKWFDDFYRKMRYRNLIIR